MPFVYDLSTNSTQKLNEIKLNLLLHTTLLELNNHHIYREQTGFFHFFSDFGIVRLVSFLFSLSLKRCVSGGSVGRIREGIKDVAEWANDI